MKFGVCSDLHFGITTHGTLDPDTGINSMVTRFFNSFETYLAQIQERGAEMLLIAGDIFHHRNPTNAVRGRFAKIIGSIAQDIPVVIIPGNHDILTSRGAGHTLLEIQEIQPNGIDVVDHPMYITRKDVSILCMPWSPNMSEDFMGQAKKTMKPLILMGHGTVQGGKVGSEKLFELYGDDVVPLDRIRELGCLHNFFGHLHRHQRVAKDITYCGSLDRLDFGERLEDKGGLFCELTGGEVKVEHISANPVSFIQYDLDLTETQDLDFEAITEGHEGAVVKVVIKCTQKQKGMIDFEQLFRKLQGAVHVSSVDINVDDFKERKRVEGMNMETSPEESLKLWLGTRNLDKGVQKKVMEEGRKILHG